MRQLMVPPTSAERRAGLANVVPALDPRTGMEERPPDELTVYVARPSTWSRLAIAQVACTAEADPGVRRAMIVGLAIRDDEKIAGVRHVPEIGLLNAKGDSWPTFGCGQFRDLIAPSSRP
ncbi:hypothetical protein [Actinomadura rubrisoli]|uniref:Uncharacterized protein n=1 Tax=Actinomadura rubrisoli TaxID=2530368 RepID=A0A4R5B7Z5_9ACTN|nr:hypothetical protein [Actinomadura rubrisoli]TDD81515.1 hypothetical protein E1298_23990 [Actinomadura rubrisoli]